jgi:hypothetical protein
MYLGTIAGFQTTIFWIIGGFLQAFSGVKIAAVGSLRSLTEMIFRMSR